MQNKLAKLKYLPKRKQITRKTYRNVHGFFVDAAKGNNGSGSTLIFEESNVTVGTLTSHNPTINKPM